VRGGPFVQSLETSSSAPVAVASFGSGGEPSPSSAPPMLPRLGSILRRRWPLLVVLPLLALVIAGVNYATTPRVYTATGRVTVTDQSPPPGEPLYAEYYRNLSSEAATDDLTKIATGSVFMDDVTARLQAAGNPVPEKDVRAAINSARVFRILTLTATANDHGRAVVIARAGLDTLVAKSPSYFPNRPVKVDIIDLPTEASVSTLKARVLALGTVLAALIAAALIALIVERFDPRLYDRRDVEDVLGVPVLGTIPRASQAAAGGRRRTGKAA